MVLGVGIGFVGSFSQSAGSEGVGGHTDEKRKMEAGWFFWPRLSGQFLFKAAKRATLQRQGSRFPLWRKKRRRQKRRSKPGGLKADTESYVRQLDSDLEELDQELTSLSGQITDKEAEIDETKKQLEQAKKTEEEQYNSMKLRIKYMYEKGDTSYLDLLMNPDLFPRC